MSENSSSSSSNFGCLLWIVCLLATTVLLAIKYSAAPSIPLWVALLPLIPIGIQLAFLLLLLLFGLGCLVIGGITAVVEERKWKKKVGK